MVVVPTFKTCYLFKINLPSYICEGALHRDKMDQLLQHLFALQNFTKAMMIDYFFLK